ncbi:MAG: response regulator [Chlorobiaceae bacterium]|nr:response regulator [Chlorobiaceae bacterium]
MSNRPENPSLTEHIHDKAVFTLLGSLPEPAFLIDPNGTLVYANSSFAEKLERPSALAGNPNIFELQASGPQVPEIATGLKEQVDRALSCCRQIEFEEEHEGKRFHYIITPDSSAGGDITRLYVIIHEIAEQRFGRHELLKKLALSRSILDAIPCAVAISDAAGHLIWWNQYTRDFIAGKPEREMPGFDAFETIHPDDQADARRQFRDILQSGIEHAVVVRRGAPGGSGYLWRMINGRRIMIDGQPYVLSIDMDITERKRIETELKESRARLDFTLQKNHIGWWDLDLQNNTVQRTIEHDRIFGYESLLPSWTGDDFLAHVVPEDRAEVERRIEESNRKLEDWNIECRILRKDGEQRWIWAAAGYLQEREGEPYRLSGIIQDITDRKREEETREKMQLQLQQAQKMELVSQLAGGIAHDFNNALTAILGNTELLLETVDRSSPQFRSLCDIKRSAENSADLTRKLLGFARMQTIAPQVFELDEAIQHLLPMLGRLIGENIELEFTPSGSRGKVCVDPSQLDQVVTQLCINARDAISGNGTVAIGTASVHVKASDCMEGHPCKEPGEYLRLSITDSGCGIDQLTLPHIFEPYFTTRETGTGGGLGLSTVEGIVKQNHGYIDIRSRPDEGTSIDIYLPCRHDQETSHEARESGDQGRETILLVEDEHTILALLENALEGKGYRVFTAANAEDALALTGRHRQKFDLLVTDVILPRMNGIRLSETLREREPDLRVLFMSGYIPDTIFTHDMTAGTQHYLQKPFSLNEFFSAVFRALHPSGKTE